MRHFGSLVVVTASLAGCAADDTAGLRNLPAPPTTFIRAEDAPKTPVLARWWLAIDDTELTRLIELGLAQSPNVAAAEARLRQARAGLAGAKAGRLPALGGSALAARADVSGPLLGGNGPVELYNLGFDAQWELDLWGGQRRGVDKAKAGADQAAAGLADAQVSLSAEIARSYVVLRAREGEGRLLAQRHALELRLLVMAKARTAAGRVPQMAVDAAAIQLDQTAAEQAFGQGEISALRDALAAMTGQMPGALDDLSMGKVPRPPVQVAIGDPAEMLARRPDMRAAEARLKAAVADVGMAQVRRLPQVALLGMMGLGGPNLGDVVDPAQLSTLAIPRLTWNMLDFGRTAANLRGARAGRDAEMAVYQASMLNSLQDAEGALARFGAARQVAGRAAATVQHAEAIAAAQDLRAKAGVISVGESLESQRKLIDAQLAEGQMRGQWTVAYVSVAKALGLGWKDTP
ncbi:MAG: hypothetical protein RLY97_927 [Pseudomonadota bacterium]